MRCVGSEGLFFGKFWYTKQTMRKLEVRLIRHAKGTHMLNPNVIAGRSLDATLTEEGVGQAEAKGRELLRRGIMPDYVASSTAERCRQTAQKILASMGIAPPIDLTEDLLEMDQGNFVGRLRTEVYNDAVLREIQERKKDFKLPGGESMNEVGIRGTDWLRTKEGLWAERKLSVVAIAHAGLITHTVGRIENWDQPKSFAMLKTMPPVGETNIVFDGEEWHVDYFARPILEIG